MLQRTSQNSQMKLLCEEFCRNSAQISTEDCRQSDAVGKSSRSEPATTTQVMGKSNDGLPYPKKWHQRPIEVFPWRLRSGKKLIPARIPINCMALGTKLDNWASPKTCLNPETRDTEGDSRISTYNHCGCNSKGRKSIGAWNESSFAASSVWWRTREFLPCCKGQIEKSTRTTRPAA